MNPWFKIRGLVLLVIFIGGQTMSPCLSAHNHIPHKITEKCAKENSDDLFQPFFDNSLDDTDAAAKKSICFLQTETLVYTPVSNRTIAPAKIKSTQSALIASNKLFVEYGVYRI